MVLGAKHIGYACVCGGGGGGAKQLGWKIIGETTWGGTTRGNVFL